MACSHVHCVLVAFAGMLHNHVAGPFVLLCADTPLWVPCSFGEYYDDLRCSTGCLRRSRVLSSTCATLFICMERFCIVATA
jgi:hypothetical protein